MPASTVFSGARAIFKVAGKPVGYAVNCGGTTGINYQPLNVLGHLETVEHVPVAYTVEMNASLARIADKTRLNTGTSFPGLRADVDGGSDSPQIMPSFGSDGKNILQSGELESTIVDRILAKTVYTIKGVKCSQKSWEVAAGAMVSENCTFVARIMAEEGELDDTLGDSAA